MHEHDIYTGKDLYSKSEFELIRWFGKRTRTLSKARGIDDSEVKASRIRKSVGTERTFQQILMMIKRFYKNMGTFS